MVEKEEMRIRNLGRVVAILAIVLMLAGPAFSQFMVTPMIMELTPRSRQRIETILQIINEDPKQAKIMDLILVDLSQWESGMWRIIEPGSDFDTSKLSSCADWIKFSADSVEVGPMRMVPVKVQLNVPPAVRGFYGAAILVMERPRPDVIGVALVVRFVIPVLVEIQGRPMQQKIELRDIGMEFRESMMEQPATTLVSMGIKNNGGTYSHLNASAVVKNFSGGHWRKITETEFRPVSIIPGVEFNLKSDIGRSLPSGKYKVTGTLYVDGRRVKELEKEIDFSGDPGITRAAADAALNLAPLEVIIKNAITGATRTSVIKVENTSEDAVNVTTGLTIPSTLKGVAFGELKGEDLVCTEWVKVTPEEFTLRGGARQNLRIIAKMPNSELTQANYYTLLGLRASYLDGQSAGVTTALICVENKNVEARPAASPMKLTIAAGEASEYVVVGRFSNVGNTNFTPRCTATVTTAMGRTIAKTLLAGKAGVMLPLEMRDFSGVVDFSKVAAGTYRLTAILEYAGEKVSTEIPIQVSIGPDKLRSVEIVKPKEAPEEKLGIEQ